MSYLWKGETYDTKVNRKASLIVFTSLLALAFILIYYLLQVFNGVKPKRSFTLHLRIHTAEKVKRPQRYYCVTVIIVERYFSWSCFVELLFNLFPAFYLLLSHLEAKRYCCYISTVSTLMMSLKRKQQAPSVER